MCLQIVAGLEELCLLQQRLRIFAGTEIGHAERVRLQLANGGQRGVRGDMRRRSGTRSCRCAPGSSARPHWSMNATNFCAAAWCLLDFKIPAPEMSRT